MFIQVVQDIACPWCRIGKHNLDVALQRWYAQGGEPIDVQWFPYLLDPIEKGARENYRQRLIERKGLQPDQIEAMWARVASVGAAAGLEFHFDRIEYAASTLPAHQLVALSPAALQGAVVHALQEALFVHGKDLEDIEVLIGVAREAGVDPERLPQLRADLESGARLDDVNAMIQQAQAAGITGVPFFIFDGKLSLSGAQPPETILAAIEQVAKQEAPVHLG
jgi:predicted DsbA family dithiol-disulfide isomerase